MLPSLSESAQAARSAPSDILHLPLCFSKLRTCAVWSSPGNDISAEAEWPQKLLHFQFLQLAIDVSKCQCGLQWTASKATYIAIKIFSIGACCFPRKQFSLPGNYVTQQWKEGPINQEKNYAQGKHPTKNGEFQKSIYNIALVLPLLQDEERKKRACGA